MDMTFTWTWLFISIWDHHQHIRFVSNNFMATIHIPKGFSNANTRNRAINHFNMGDFKRSFRKFIIMADITVALGTGTYSGTTHTVPNQTFKTVTLLVMGPLKFCKGDIGVTLQLLDMARLTIS